MRKRQLSICASVDVDDGDESDSVVSSVCQRGLADVLVSSFLPSENPENFLRHLGKVVLYCTKLLSQHEEGGDFQQRRHTSDADASKAGL